MPAAAVIPAPMAYTNIAAVKTLVVCRRAAGLLGGRLLSWLGPLALGLVGPASVTPDSTPSGMSLRPPLLRTVRTAPAKSLLHCRPKRIMPPTLATDTQGDPALCRAHTPVHHRSPPSSTPWKTQCAQSSFATAECPSMECQGIDRVWHWSCAGLGAHSGQPGGCAHGIHVRGLRSLWPPGLRSAPLRPRGLHPSIVTDGTVRGERYGSARGEILRSLPDPLQRRRSASARPSIKNESSGSKDDQTPS